MGLFDVLLGRSKPVRPNLDALFALPSAALTLEAALGLRPTGIGSVVVKAAEGDDFDAARQEAGALLRFEDDVSVEDSRDSFGYLWATCRTAPDRLPDLVTALHAANRTYADAGFGAALLCSLITFAGQIDGAARTVALVYLYKRGSFYPFAPLAGQRRNSELELSVRGQLAGELTVEEDLTRWFPLWDAPGASA